MNNNIDKIITTADGSKYMVIDQGNYNNKAYYLTSKLNATEDLTEELNIFENNDGYLEEVNEPELKEALAEYFKKRLDK